MFRSLSLIVLALLLGCAAPDPYRNAEVSGQVSYREKIVYGPDATLIVFLVDASGPESPLQVELQKLDSPDPGAELLAATSIEGMIPSPTDFALAVPLDKIDQGHDYRLKAVILDQGRPVMAAGEPPLVLTKGRPVRVDLVLVPLPLG